MTNETVYAVPAGWFFVLNDNREQLFDSRTMGPIPGKQLVAKVLFIYKGKASYISP